MLKLETTKECVRALLHADGDQDIGQIIAECKVQAYASQVPEALRQLVAAGEIYYNHDEQVFSAL